MFEVSQSFWSYQTLYRIFYRIMNDISALKNLISNCSCDKKVHVLKKCVSKMEKSFQRSEKEYLKQIEHLRQELDLKENTLQV